MGLALGVLPGDKIFLDDTPLEVVSVDGYEAAQVKVNDTLFDLSDKESTEVYPGVKVCCGEPQAREITIKNRVTGVREAVMPQSRLMFEASGRIKILREVLYRNAKTYAKAAVAAAAK